MTHRYLLGIYLVRNVDVKAAMGGSTEVLDSTNAAGLNLFALLSSELSLEHCRNSDIDGIR